MSDIVKRLRGRIKDGNFRFGDDPAIMEAEDLMLQAADEIERLRTEIATLKSKAAKQRNEIARLTQALEVATEEKRRAVDDLKWMRGEK